MNRSIASATTLGAAIGWLLTGALVSLVDFGTAVVYLLISCGFYTVSWFLKP